MVKVEKKRKYQREWIAKRRLDFFRDKLCSICASSDSLELHHANPSEKTSHKIWSWKKERMEAEITKCVILCRTCHKNLHYPIVHGINRYKRHGCRCQICKDANAEKSKKYRANKCLKNQIVKKD